MFPKPKYSVEQIFAPCHLESIVQPCCIHWNCLYWYQRTIFHMDIGFYILTHTLLYLLLRSAHF